jgi:hypothetical protein
MSVYVYTRYIITICSEYFCVWSVSANTRYSTLRSVTTEHSVHEYINVLSVCVYHTRYIILPSVDTQ